ncbi:metallophosphoesterase [Bradyrhizobium sp. Tv2a-2]|uniref:metallophosphoesterase n=1 Tax=Bradyrhizobium sp. Tv2a-2 TaxID=113395 RepID=UPI0018DE0951|nr:metallophosphoesterase [Bradyrhizobium sp. Tv2a-2]
MPDLHGRLDLFERAVAAILRHAKATCCKLITLGDYVDRGPESRQLVERLLNWREPTLRLIALKGNHEAMMWEACNGFLEMERWLGNGGKATLASYGVDARHARDAIPKDHLAWINLLPLMHVDRDHIFVHAAVDPKLALAQQNEATLLWKRYPSGFEKGHGRRHVVHGHDGTAAAPVVSAGKSNLDGLAWKTGRLVVGIYVNGRPGPAADYLDISA